MEAVTAIETEETWLPEELRASRVYNRSVNVYDAALKRVDFVFKNFDRIYLSFSGGKDSGCMELNDSERKAANTLAGNYVLDWELRYKAKGRRVRQDMGAARLRWRDTGGSAGRINERDAGTIVQGYLYSDFAE